MRPVTTKRGRESGGGRGAPIGATKTTKAPKAPKATQNRPAAAKSKSAKRPTVAKTTTRAAAPLAKVLADGAQVLFDLVCDVDGRIEGGLSGKACKMKARAHNAANPDHSASCVAE
jgi:hypothetical protein